MGVLTVDSLPAALGAGEQVTLTVQYTAPAMPGAVQVKAVVATSSDEDGATANNSATGQTIVTTSTDADVTVTVQVLGDANPGSTVDGKVVFENKGPAIELQRVGVIAQPVRGNTRRRPVRPACARHRSRFSRIARVHSAGDAACRRATAAVAEGDTAAARGEAAVVGSAAGDEALRTLAKDVAIGGADVDIKELVEGGAASVISAVDIEIAAGQVERTGPLVDDAAGGR